MKLPTIIAIIKKTIPQNPNPRFARAAPISPKNRSGSPIITRRINRISTQGDTGLYSIRDTVLYLFSEDIDSLVKPNETLISFKVPFI